MKTFFKLVLGLLALGALAVVAVVAMRQTFTTPPERIEAQRLLAAPMPALAGRDASEAAFLAGYDIPADQRAATYAAFRQWVEDGQKEGKDPREAFLHLSKLDPGSAGLCGDLQADCLATVRVDPAATAALLAQHAATLRAARELVAHDGLRLGMKSSLATPLPNLSYGRALLVTAIADRAARGEVDAAIGEACDDLAGWRRIGADTDVLIVSMVGAAYVGQDARLLVSLLAERPADAPLPAACDAALAATQPVELDLCPSYRQEYEMAKNTIGDLATMSDLGMEPPSSLEMLGMRTMDKEHFSALVAPQLARACRADVKARMAADATTKGLPQSDPECGIAENIAFAADCTMATIAIANLDPYLDRRTDQAAKLALVRTWLWLRAQSPDPAGWAALLPTRPAELGLRREATVDAAAGVLSMPLLDDRQAKTFALPLPRTTTPAVDAGASAPGP
jgi:hypothetical protein